ncbi:MAG: phosphopantetheine-binding protein [Methylovirgula sp.]
MYRTGDSVRRQSNGTLEFLGRLDHQVKIRGFRVELGETEAALERVTGVRQAVVIAEPDSHGEHRLVGYYIASSLPVPAADLRARLAETLPGYMVPNAFVPVASFPLTPNGKIDRKKLPVVADAPALEVESAPVEARTATEALLTQLWCELLGNQRIGVHSNFFELGGHSLLAVRAVARINEMLDVRLNVAAFFMNPTIARLAGVIDQRNHIDSVPRIVTLRTGVGVPTYLIGARPDEYRIAELICGERPIFAVDAPIDMKSSDESTSAARPSLPTIEKLGKLFADPIQAHAKSSQCVIIGYSLSGKFAFEAARQLQRAGGNVVLVVVVDAWARSWYGTNRATKESLRWIWRNISGRKSNVSRVSALMTSLDDIQSLAGWIIRRIPGALRYRFELLKQHYGRGTLHYLLEPSGILTRTEKRLTGRLVSDWLTMLVVCGVLIPWM